MLFCDNHPGEAHLTEGLPQLTRDAIGVVAVTQGPQVGDRCVLAQEAIGGVLQHRLFFGQDQRHPLRLQAVAACVWR